GAPRAGLRSGESLSQRSPRGADDAEGPSPAARDRGGHGPGLKEKLTMMTMLATALITLVTVTARTDTTFKVDPGSRLSVNNFGGQITVQAWGKNAVRIEAQHSERILVHVQDQGSNIE